MPPLRGVGKPVAAGTLSSAGNGFDVCLILMAAAQTNTGQCLRQVPQSRANRVQSPAIARLRCWARRKNPGKDRATDCNMKSAKLCVFITVLIFCRTAIKACIYRVVMHVCLIVTKLRFGLANRRFRPLSHLSNLLIFSHLHVLQCIAITHRLDKLQQLCNTIVYEA